MDKEVTYCVVNLFGYAYDTNLMTAINKIKPKENEAYRIYAFKTKDMPRHWSWWCPIWDNDNKIHRFQIIADTMGGIKYHLPALFEQHNGTDRVVNRK